jgi:hypothetical protein
MAESFGYANDGAPWFEMVVSVLGARHIASKHRGNTQRRRDHVEMVLVIQSSIQRIHTSGYVVAMPILRGQKAT